MKAEDKKDVSSAYFVSITGKLKYKDYSIDVSTQEGMFYGTIKVFEKGYQLMFLTICNPVVGINVTQSCGIRGVAQDGVTYEIFGQASRSGTMMVRAGWIKTF